MERIAIGEAEGEAPMAEEKGRARSAPEPLPEPPADYDPISEEPVSAVPSSFGMRLVEWREGFAAVECVVTEALSNRQGVVHGGATATLIDTAAGYAVVYCPYPGRRRNAFTLSLTTQFLSAARGIGGVMRAEARLVGGGAAVAFVDAQVFDQDRRLLATSSGVFRLRSDSRSLWGAPRDG